MTRILANDGLHPAGLEMLRAYGYQVDTDKIPQEELKDKLPAYDAILVRSATKVRADLMDACPNLKFIGRGGVGLDNIDVEYAEGKDIKVANTPAASSQSVAELAIGQMFVMSRFLHESNRAMPTEGGEHFKELKKAYSKGRELRGKTVGIFGFGRIGQAVARAALGLGMNVMPSDPLQKNFSIDIEFFKIKDAKLSITLHRDTSADIFKHADFITVHVPKPADGKALLDKEAFDKMKDGVCIINTSRGGVVDEEALIKALDSGKVANAALDVYVNEPAPSKAILEHPRISLTPHIGASTVEAQERIGTDLAGQLIQFFG